jgi:thymidine phosphorylase
VLNVVDDERIVGPTSSGSAEDAFARSAACRTDTRRASRRPSRRPRSRRCTARSPASGSAAKTCAPSCDDIAGHRYSKIELTAFVVATNQFELDREEVCT